MRRSRAFVGGPTDRRPGGDRAGHGRTAGGRGDQPPAHRGQLIPGRRGGRDTRPALGLEAGPPAPILRLTAGGCAARWQRIAPARSRLAEALAGVRRITVDGLAQWRYHGRLVARQLDDAHVVIRARTLGAISPTRAA